MAALMRHGVSKSFQMKTQINVSMSTTIRGFASKARRRLNNNVDKKQPPKIDSTAKSIAAKGFLRPQRSYSPPEDVNQKLESIFQSVLGNTNGTTLIGTANKKFELFSLCAREFAHPIPNSLLHTIESLNDVKKFYQTPVDTITPLDKMRNMELPENLHVETEYHRFHPDTDTRFNGQTAFNRSSTLVTGLKYKDKYKGHIQNQTWPFNS